MLKHICITNFVVHKDPYENIYCVVSGEKNFTLHPPTDLPWIPYQNYPSAVYKSHAKNKWTVEPINDTIHESERIVNSTLTPWICIDPLKPDYEKFSIHNSPVFPFFHIHTHTYIHTDDIYFKKYSE